MWIIRFQKLQPKDYNKITRLVSKAGFHTRRIAPIVYAKAMVLHVLQKRSLRSVSQEFHMSHIGLHKFLVSLEQTPEYEKIFHVFLESRSTLYIDDTREFTRDDLDNNDEIYALTEKQLQSILQTKSK